MEGKGHFKHNHKPKTHIKKERKKEERKSNLHVQSRRRQ